MRERRTGFGVVRRGCFPQGGGKKTLYIGNLKIKPKKKILISNPPRSQERGFPYPPCFSKSSMSFPLSLSRDTSIIPNLVGGSKDKKKNRTRLGTIVLGGEGAGDCYQERILEMTD